MTDDKYKIIYNTRLYMTKSEIQKEHLNKFVTQPCFKVERKSIEYHL